MVIDHKFKVLFVASMSILQSCRDRAVACPDSFHELRVRSAEVNDRKVWRVRIVDLAHQRTLVDQVLIGCTYGSSGGIAWDSSHRAWFLCGDTQLYVFWSPNSSGRWVFHNAGSASRPVDKDIRPPDYSRFQFQSGHAHQNPFDPAVNTDRR
jgi:hypothetical protein